MFVDYIATERGVWWNKGGNYRRDEQFYVCMFIMRLENGMEGEQRGVHSKVDRSSRSWENSSLVAMALR